MPAAAAAASTEADAAVVAGAPVVPQLLLHLCNDSCLQQAVQGSFTVHASSPSCWPGTGYQRYQVEQAECMFSCMPDYKEGALHTSWDRLQAAHCCAIDLMFCA
jgi:hypothetical protein